MKQHEFIDVCAALLDDYVGQLKRELLVVAEQLVNASAAGVGSRPRERSASSAAAPRIATRRRAAVRPASPSSPVGRRARQVAGPAPFPGSPAIVTTVDRPASVTVAAVTEAPTLPPDVTGDGAAPQGLSPTTHGPRGAVAADSAPVVDAAAAAAPEPAAAASTATPSAGPRTLNRAPSESTLRVAELLRAGKRPSEIAAELGVTEPRVYEIRRRWAPEVPLLGGARRVSPQTPQIVEALRAGRRPDEIAADLGVAESQVWSVRARHARDVKIGRKRGPRSERVERMIEMLRAGWHPDEIAAAIGVDPSTVRQARKRWAPDLAIPRRVRSDAGRPRDADRTGPTGRAAQIVELIGVGKSAKEIAAELDCDTVDVYRARARWCPGAALMSQRKAKTIAKHAERAAAGYGSGTPKHGHHGAPAAVARGRDGGITTPRNRSIVDDAIERLNEVPVDPSAAFGFHPCRDDRCANDELHEAGGAACTRRRAPRTIVLVDRGLTCADA